MEGVMIQRLVFGLAQGGVYSMMALALGIIYSTTRIMNFCHADIVMFGAMISYSLIQVHHVSYAVGIVLSTVLNATVSILIYEICVRYVGDLSTNTNWMITLFGFGVLLKNGARLIFGSDTNVFPYLFNGKTVKIGSANIMIHELVMIGSAIVIGLIYEIICQKTRYGRALRAVSYKPDTAKLMGINSRAIIVTCFAVAGAIAAYAGSLIAPITFASYSMTSSVGLKGYAAALIGGLGNTKGAFVGGLLLGLIECIITIFLPAGIKDAISFVIMILVIIFMPGGIMNAKIFSRGKTSVEKI